LLLVGLQGYWVQIFVGIVLLAAVLINRVLVARLAMLGESDRASSNGNEELP
jgi:hypothetical protein